MKRQGFIVAGLSVLLSVGTGATLAQTYNLGARLTEPEINALDTLVDIDGERLPKGQGTVSEGATLYAQRCAFCHGPNGEGTRSAAGRGPVLVRHGDEAGIDRLYFSTTLFSYILRAMPMHAERTLSVDQAYALTAFLLHRNDIIKETDVMSDSTLGEVKMPRQDKWEPPSLEISG